MTDRLEDRKTKSTEVLFTRREGCRCKRVKVSSDSQVIFTGRVTMSPGSTLPALLTCFVMRDILCNGLKFELILKFSMGNTLNSRKRENIIIVDRNQMFIIKFRNWIIAFKLARLLVTHVGGKVTRIGELSLAQRLQGR